MRMLLELTGMAPYHATCLSPVIWAIAALAIVYLTIGWLDAWSKRQRRRMRRRERSRM